MPLSRIFGEIWSYFKRVLADRHSYVGVRPLAPEVAPPGARKVRDPLAPGAEAPFGHVLDADDFVGNVCVVCGRKAALFIVQGNYVGACPNCLALRIAHLRGRSATTLPDWLISLESEAFREVEAQQRREDASLTVTWDDLVRCDRCHRLIALSEARYFIPTGAQSSPPYCPECRAPVSDGTSS